jgi:hypothetical protein
LSCAEIIKTSCSPTGELLFPSAVWEKACTAILGNFRSLRKFSDPYSSMMQRLTKNILTTKITKAAKGSDILIINFVLFVAFVVRFPVSFLVAASPH